jgi:predicted nuclease with TOPRIM domain
VRSLRTLGSVDDVEYEELQVELEVMRENMQENIDQFGALEQEIRAASAALDQAGSDELEVSSRLDQLLGKVEPLRQRAMSRAVELKAETELAEQRYIARWHDEVSEFEQNLYIVMCNYGSTLRALPEDENISIILKGLGEDSETTTRRPDKIHILLKQDIQECQQGEIDIAELRERSEHYSY